MSEFSQAPLPMVDGRALPGAVDGDGALPRAELLQQRAFAASRERISLVIGIVAERYGLSPEEAWELLVGVSQRSNVKLRDVARVIHDGFCHCLDDRDLALAQQVNDLGPAGARPLVRLEVDDKEASGA